MFLCLYIQSADKQTRVHSRSAEHRQGVFSEKPWFYIQWCIKGPFFFFAFLKSLQKTKTVNQIVAQSVGQWTRDLILWHVSVLPCQRDPDGPRYWWPEQRAVCLSDRQQHGATGPLLGNHANVSNQAVTADTTCGQRQSRHIFNKWLKRLKYMAGV